MLRSVALTLLACAAAPDARPSRTWTTTFAAQDLPAGWEIREEHLVRVEVPGPRPRGFVDAYAAPEEVVGRRTIERVLAGEPIREERLQDFEIGFPTILPRTPRRLAFEVPTGSVASEVVGFGTEADVLVRCVVEGVVEVSRASDRVWIEGVGAPTAHGTRPITAHAYPHAY
ncbi:MAG: SAF domain-containing protein, partial [Myxococcales bacterium]|nr:SAF domain-containing protein [Myxococcales bacterium]